MNGAYFNTGNGQTMPGHCAIVLILIHASLRIISILFRNRWCYHESSLFKN